VTVNGLSVLSTTWKSTDGTLSHWKYIIDNVNVYRDVYRGTENPHRLPAIADLVSDDISSQYGCGEKFTKVGAAADK
jgi:hypothetical protein